MAFSHLVHALLFSAPRADSLSHLAATDKHYGGSSQLMNQDKKQEPGVCRTHRQPESDTSWHAEERQPEAIPRPPARGVLPVGPSRVSEGAISEMSHVAGQRPHPRTVTEK